MTDILDKCALCDSALNDKADCTNPDCLMYEHPSSVSDETRKALNRQALANLRKRRQSKLNTSERGDVTVYAATNEFFQARYIYGNVIQSDLALHKGCERELALLLAMAVEQGVLEPERLEACLTLAKSYVKDKTPECLHCGKHHTGECPHSKVKA